MDYTNDQKYKGGQEPLPSSPLSLPIPRRGIWFEYSLVFLLSPLFPFSFFSPKNNQLKLIYGVARCIFISFFSPLNIGAPFPSTFPFLPFNKENGQTKIPLRYFHPPFFLSFPLWRPLEECWQAAMKTLLFFFFFLFFFFLLNNEWYVKEHAGI